MSLKHLPIPVDIKPFPILHRAEIAGFYSEVQPFEVWQYNFTVITRKATEDGIQAFNKEAAIYD